jgi:RHS repeat-associated protein
MTIRAIYSRNAYCYRARYYDSTVGRFLNEDPITFGGGMNFYTYVGNRAATATDPSGFNSGQGAISIVT